MTQDIKYPGIVLAAGFAGLLLILLVIWLLTVYTGAYNVAATEPHADIVRWTFDTTMQNSVKDRARHLTPPEQISEDRLRSGARIYAETCIHCHGAPGDKHESWASNMRPQPPDLAETAADWETREIFWIVKHGIKMTGMPAFEPEHDDDEIWNIATFVKRLPGMTAEIYQETTRGAHRH